MAEAAILAALKVLGEILAKEVGNLAISNISELRSTYTKLKVNMNNISSELRVMKGFLNEIETDQPSNMSHVAWIKEIQKLANHIEDIVVEFAYLIGNQKFDRISFNVAKFFRKSNLLVNFKQISFQLIEAEKTLKHLAEMKERWVPTINVRIGKNLDYSNRYSHNVAVSAHFIDEDHLVGIKENRVTLTEWLNLEDPQLYVISVWGMGGVGKTTLVTNVFKRERENFDCHAWVSISQSYTIENILRNIITEISKHEQNLPIETTNMDLRGLKENLRDILKQMKYVIVLDDMWDPKVFLDISDTFIDNHRGSRIIITSRMAEVANIALERNRLELKPLLENESWDLFCRKAFHLEQNHECPPPLEKLARKIVFKCDGLPLALVSIGVMLSLFEKTESEWRRLFDQLNWQIDNNPSLGPLKNILNLSFNYLPRYLKNCFMYCGLFPEDSLLARKKLIRLWIAEGFVEQKGTSTLEEVAEGYLMDLIHRSMLQVVRKNYFGRVKRCQMHDTLREIAISLCRKENFGLLHEDNMSENIDSSTRRLSMIKLKENIKHDGYLPKLRTFLSVDYDVISSPLLSIIFDKSRYLTVLDLEGLPIEMVPNAIGDLFNLHYLGLRRTKVKFLHYLPIKGMFYLKEVQTIQALESNAIAVNELGNLTQLRSFRIRNVKENHSADLCRSLSKMNFLSHLSINASDEKEILQLEGLNLPQLQKLELYGRLKEQMVESPLFQFSGERIQSLILSWSQLQHDPLPSLSHCRNLTFLYLRSAYVGHQLTFQAGWFPKLKCLMLGLMPNLIQMEVEQGTMVSLEELYLWELEQLVDVPVGMKHLVSLKMMFCTEMLVDFGGLPKGTHLLFHFTCVVRVEY